MIKIIESINDNNNEKILADISCLKNGKEYDPCHGEYCLTTYKDYVIDAINCLINLIDDEDIDIIFYDDRNRKVNSIYDATSVEIDGDLYTDFKIVDVEDSEEDY